jgi:tRNA A-37 threonylcarbamoyl transferase component Bud32
MSQLTQCPDCGQTYDSKLRTGCAACQIKLGLDDTVKPARSPQIPAISAEELAPHFEDLEILDLIGVGGMGAVYRARQKKLDREVAIKVVRPDISESQEFSQRFEREAKAMARLNHPNIVSIYDFGNTDGIFYYLMELVDGPNLAELAGSESLTPQETLEIVTQVCQAMQYAHDNGVVHRDIKPTNILVNAEGTVKIADFGLAKLCSVGDPTTQLTQTQQVFGTPRYMAPEQIESTREVDHRADIYSLGVVFYELLTGELPLGRFDPPSEKISIDVRLDEVVLRALEKHPERRYQAAREFQTDISQIVRPVPPVKQAMASSPAVVDPPETRLPNWKVPALVIPGSILATLGIYAAAVWVSLESFPTYGRRPVGPVLFLGFAALMVGVCMLAAGLVVGVRNLPSQQRAKMRQRSPVRMILNFRVLIYSLLVLLLVATALPWLEYRGGLWGLGYVHGFQISISLGAALLLCLGIPMLIFIDVYEGTRMYFFITLMILAGLSLAASINMIQPSGAKYFLKSEFLDTADYGRLYGEALGTIVHVVVSHILLILGGIGIVSCGVNKLFSPSVKQGTGRVISKTGGTLVQWRDRFSDFVNGNR